MKSQQSRGSDRRRGGGGRRPRQRDDAPRSSYPSAPAKQSFWQKLVSFFKPAPKPANGSRPNYESASTTPPPAYTQRTARKPEAVDVTSPKLYIGNLSYDATESDLSELFKGVGTVANVEVVSHKGSEKSKGFGFVTMTTIDEAKRAVVELHDQDFMGRKLVVSGAKTPA